MLRSGPTLTAAGERVTVEHYDAAATSIWIIIFSGDHRDLQHKGLIGSFIKGGAASSQARELLVSLVASG
jgi:hypothetical protein